MGRSLNDFIVDWNTHCFLCMAEVLPPSKMSVKAEAGLRSSSSMVSSITSVEGLSRYLKMDMTKAFREDRPIPQGLLEKLRRSQLKVELCKECSLVSGRFSELYQKLEKIEMEVLVFLERIQGKLINGEIFKIDENFWPSETDKPKGDAGRQLGKLEIFKRLRLEAMEKCGRKLGSIPPRVKMEKTVINSRAEVKCNSICKIETEQGQEAEFIQPSFDDQSDQDIEIGQVKVERLNTGSDKSKSGTGSKLSSQRKRKIFGGRVKVKCNGVAKWKCLVCSKLFTTPGNHRRHYKSMHLGLKVKCDLCNKLFSEKSHVIRHQKMNNCGIRAVKQLELGDRMDSDEPTKDKLRCHICNKKYYDLSTHHFVVHFRRWVERRGNKNEDCAPIKVRSSKVKGKFSVNPKTGKIICGLCSADFFSDSGYQGHHKRAHLKERYKCKVCGNEFRDRCIFTAHYRNVHMGVRFQCRGCDKVFTLKVNLAAHLTMTSCGSRGEKRSRKLVKPPTPGWCHLCGETFTASKNLYDHLRLLHLEKEHLSDESQATPDQANRINIKEGSSAIFPVPKEENWDSDESTDQVDPLAPTGGSEGGIFHRQVSNLSGCRPDPIKLAEETSSEEMKMEEEQLPGNSKSTIGETPKENVTFNTTPQSPPPPGKFLHTSRRKSKLELRKIDEVNETEPITLVTLVPPLNSVGQLATGRNFLKGRYKFKCSLCSKEFTRRDYLRAHYNRVHHKVVNLSLSKMFV